MSDTSRRKLLAVAGAGAAAGTVGLTTGKAAAAVAAVRPNKNSAQERVLAVIDDHGSDQLVLLVGEREVVVSDRELVVRILNAAGGK